MANDSKLLQDRQTTIAAYLRHAAKGSGDDDRDFWAWEAVDDFIRAQTAARCWELVLELLTVASDESIGLVIAGPLEDTVRRHGTSLINRIEEQSTTDERLRLALGGIWLSQDDLPPAVLQRVILASGGEIQPLPPLRYLEQSIREEGRMTKTTKGSESPAKLITERIASLGDWRGKTLARMRALIKEADPGVVEEWKWMGTPVWEHDGIICTGESYKSVVKLTFHKGASLKDPKKLFNSSLEGNARRAIDIREGEELNATAFKALIREAVALNATKKKKKPTSRA